MRPLATAAAASRLVAAITRTSVCCTCVEPTRMKVPVSSTRSSFTCSSSGISVTSSRNSVPPCARSKKPWCWRSAPVKLPHSWPKISLSIRLGDSAPQFTARNGCSRRRLMSCTARATSSLPVPLSPWMNTVTAVRATREICRYTRCISCERPTSGPKRPVSRQSSSTSSNSARNCEGAIRRESRPLRCCGLMGFTR
ncbi:hypothetical protein J2W32_001916 [Variovorax boronicumulans]|uniref:Secreted protein n=1 Tax=Variovorax boronicumulans TaxID=436515 RepID=A0AAW8CN11_9BURK|nr:hypothetical protein [Variovorax boronicumulans]MDQ0040777.1 hypothetical protein [Variovorax boronicumulans]MDQ0052870.1 hypothetical protein [Variovorax boronicumulans]